MLYDNYSYLVVDTAASVAVVVDPADPEKVQVNCVFFTIHRMCRAVLLMFKDFASLSLNDVLSEKENDLSSPSALYQL